MPDAVHIAAIDAGSNAIRLLIAQVDATGRVSKLERQRSAVRLGHGAFTRHAIDDDIVDEAVKTFATFRRLMDKRRARLYRAVATSATRNANNRRVLLERVYDKTGIELEVIDGLEEARLVRTAVLETLGPKASPRLILDLGGGSLELNFMRDRALRESLTLPVGTVRLIEGLGIESPTTQAGVEAVNRRVQSVLDDRVPRRSAPFNGLAVACGGNAESLARVAPAPQANGLPVLDLDAMARILPEMLAMDVPRRQRAYNVRRDRAEVMGVAGLVLCRLGEWLNLRHLAVPGVGVREGLIYELVQTHFLHQVRPADRSAT